MLDIFTPFSAYLIAVLVAGIATHETTHYVACRLAGAPARFWYVWDGQIPAPAVKTTWKKHTPRTAFATALSPLTVLVPSVAVFMLTSPTGNAVGLWVMWCLCLIPSPPDWQVAYHARDVLDLRAVAYGAHPNHAAAEGYPV